MTDPQLPEMLMSSVDFMVPVYLPNQTVVGKAGLDAETGVTSIVFEDPSVITELLELNVPLALAFSFMSKEDWEKLMVPPPVEEEVVPEEPTEVPFVDVGTGNETEEPVTTEEPVISEEPEIVPEEPVIPVEPEITPEEPTIP